MNKTILSFFLIAIIATACTTAPATEATVTIEKPTEPIAENGMQEDPTDLPAGKPEATEEDLISYAYPNIDTGEVKCYDNQNEIPCPEPGDAFFGQDATYTSTAMAFIDNNDGTVTDLNTGLMWMQDAGEKMAYGEAAQYAEDFSFAGYDDWRVPTIKELYSLMDFSGIDDAETGTDPFIDTDYFIFEYGDTNTGDRAIDSQWITDTIYESTVMNNQQCFFGVNFADGRIKCYPTNNNKNNGYFLRLVRGEEGYGDNDFLDNGNGTVTDLSVGLTWQQDDSGVGMDWEDAINYCENLTVAGETDWRLPNAKELQYLVDYSRSPDTTNSPAIDPLFTTTEITNELLAADWGYYWTSTTHENARGGMSAVYLSFGEAIGQMNGNWMDVHGAGAQRSDNKTDDQIDSLPYSHGPQGDSVRVYNFVRCVSNAGANSTSVVTGTHQDSVVETPTATIEDTVEVTLFAPLSGTSAYLVDMEGNTVHEWLLSASPGLAVYLLEDNSLLATTTIESDAFPEQGTAGGGIEILDWDGDPLWSFELSNETYKLHHDVEMLPNGNILAIAFEKISGKDALAAGVDPSIISSFGEIWSEAIFEINTETNQIVWEWHAWDHLLPDGENAADHPELLNPNYPTTRNSAAWLHFNSIDYNEATDQILVSSRNNNEILIIDHNITADEASGSAGDILFRWGTPTAYGESGTQVLFGQHDAEWIDPTSADSNIILFNNGNQRLQPYSTVLEIEMDIPQNAAEIVWEYGADTMEESFFADHISSVQRLQNGNTLICIGTEGRFIEINPKGELVWEYTHPYGVTTPKGETRGDVFRADRYVIETDMLEDQ